MRKFFRKSIFYKKQFNSEKIIKLDDLNFLRPEKGLKMSQLNRVIGKKLKQNVFKDKLVKLYHLK